MEGLPEAVPTSLGRRAGPVVLQGQRVLRAWHKPSTCPMNVASPVPRAASQTDFILQPSHEPHAQGIQADFNRPSSTKLGKTICHTHKL